VQPPGAVDDHRVRAVTLRGRGTYAGDDAKLEILDASGAGGSEAFGNKGSYFIVKNGGQEMLLVDPSQKQYMKWDIAAMFAGMSKVLNAVGGLVKMQISDVKIDAQDLAHVTAGKRGGSLSWKQFRSINHVVSPFVGIPQSEDKGKGIKDKETKHRCETISYPLSLPLNASFTNKLSNGISFFTKPCSI